MPQGAVASHGADSTNAPNSGMANNSEIAGAGLSMVPGYDVAGTRADSGAIAQATMLLVAPHQEPNQPGTRRPQRTIGTIAS